jgi:hypothetical protein
MKKHIPAQDRPYFVHDPEGEGFSFFANEKERDEFADHCIQAYLDDGWDEEVENVVAGVITHVATQTGRLNRPPEEEINLDGEDGEGNDWSHGFDSVCNYKLLPL